MNRKAKEIIERLAKKLSKELLEADFEYEPDELCRVKANAQVWIVEYNCDIGAFYYHDFNGNEGIEVELYDIEHNRNLPLVTEAIQVKVNELFDFGEMYSRIDEQLEDDSEDEWTSHGFRDAADYYNYRFGGWLR